MMQDYEKMTAEIIRLAGGKENIHSVAHCATRLRLLLADKEKVDEKAITELEGVKGTFFNAGQYQVILGIGTVDKVYEEALRSGISAATTEDIRYI